MRHFRKVLLSAMIIGLLFLQFGCQPIFKPRAPVQEYKVKIISDAEFVRTRQGEYVDGYLAEYESQFQKRWMFIVLEIQKYMKDERLIVKGRLTEDFVRMSFRDQFDAEVPVFEVGRAVPDPRGPDAPLSN